MEEFDIERLKEAGELLVYLNSLKAQGRELTQDELAALVNIAKEHESVFKQLEEIVQTEETYKKLADDILKTILDTVDRKELENSLNKSIQNQLKAQLESVTKISDLTGQDLLKKQESLNIFTKNARVASLALGSIGSQMNKLDILGDLLDLDGGKLNEQGRAIAEMLGLEKLVAPAGQISDKLQEAINKRKESLSSLRSEIKQQAIHRGILDETVNKIDHMYAKYGALANLIPVIGPRIGKALANANRVATEAAELTHQTFLRTNDPIKSLNAGVGRLTRGVSKLHLIVGGVVVGLFAVYKVLGRINNTVKGFSTETGLSADHSYRLYKNALNANTAFSNQLSTLKDIQSVQQGITNEFARFVTTDPAILNQISDASKILGYSAEQAGQLQVLFRELGADDAFAGNLQVAVGELAKAQKIAPGIIAKDLTKNANLVATAFAGFPIDAAKAVVQVRKLGYSLSQASRVMDHLFDIEGSITSQMEASIVLGRMIDVNAARRLALEGDIAGMMTEIAKQAGSYADFTRMSVPQRILLAKASGMEVGELQRGLFIREKLNDLTDEEFNAVQSKLVALEGVEKLSKGELRAELAKIQATEKFNAVLNKIKNSLLKTILPVAEALLPVFEVLGSLAQFILIPLKLITPILKLIGVLVEGILLPLTWLGKLLEKGLVKVEEFFGGFKIGSEKLADQAKVVIGVISGIGLAWLATSRLFGVGLSGMLSGLGKLGKALSPKKLIKSLSPKGLVQEGIPAVRDKLLGKKYGGGQFLPGGGRAKPGGQRVGGLFSRIKDRIRGKDAAKNIKESVVQTKSPVEQIKTTAKTSESIKPKAGIGVRSFLTNLADGLKAMGNSKVFKGILATALAGPALVLFLPAIPGLLVMAGVGAASALIVAGFTALSTGMSTLGTNLANIAKGAAALAIIGASIIPFGFAVGLLSGMDTSGLAGVVVSLIALGGIAAALGTVAPLLLAGSVGIAALGIALIPFAYSLKQLSEIDPKHLKYIVGGIAALGIAAAAFGALAPLIITGSVAIAALAVSLGASALFLKPLASIFERVGAGMKDFGSGMVQTKDAVSGFEISVLYEMAKGIREVSKAIEGLDLDKLKLLENIKPTTISVDVDQRLNSNLQSGALETLLGATTVNRPAPPVPNITSPVSNTQETSNVFKTANPVISSSEISITPLQAPAAIGGQAPGANDFSNTYQSNTNNSMISDTNGRMDVLLNRLSNVLEHYATKTPTVYLRFDNGTIRKIETMTRADL